METSLNGLRSTHRSFELADASSVAHARRDTTAVGAAVGLNETDLGRLALVVTEVSTNVLKHAKHGALLICVLPGERGGHAAGVEVIAIDRGPGMVDVRGSFADGHSTAGTAGTGLGAIRRLSDEIAIYSQPQLGTAIRAVVRSRDRKAGAQPRVASGIDIGGICTSLPGEEVSGDAWAVEADQEGLTVVVADGLGHGPDARTASVAAIDVVHRGAGRSPAALMGAAHVALRTTRGAAMAIARIDLVHGQLSFSGTGNIATVAFGTGRATSGSVRGAAVVGAAGRVLSSGPRDSSALLSRNGIVGHAMRDAQESVLDWPRDAMLLLHSDGIGTRWDLSAYPGLRLQPAAIIAAVLYRDFCRRTDDATIVVVKSEIAQPDFS